MKKIVMAALLLIGAAAVSHAAPVLAATDLSYHVDSRGYNTFGIVTGAPLTKNWNLWGFTDFHGNQNSGRSDLSHYFMEYRVNYDLIQVPNSINGLTLEAEYNGFAGLNNDLVRFGLTTTWATMLGAYHLRYHPNDTTKDDNSQVSLTHQIYLTDRVDLWGFYDYNILDSQKNEWVWETWLNYKLTESFTLSLEYRWNGFEDSVQDWRGDGIAVGVYKRL